MTSLSASHSGAFRIGGDIEVNRLGFGAMRIVGKGVWGEPEHPHEVKHTLRRLVELDVNLIDTADSYGPEISETLIREVLHPYDGLLIATKGGLTRSGPDAWSPDGRPEYLRACVQGSLRRLGVDRIDLWQLHRVDPKTPPDEQFGVIADMQREGLIRHVGLSEVNVEQIEAASRHFRVATVQNRYNLVDRSSEAVLNHCEAQGIGFLPWFPLAAGRLLEPGGVLDRIGEHANGTPSQVALAWLLKRSPVMLPIPGTGKVKHLEENVAAAQVQLSDEDFRALDAQGARTTQSA